MSRRPLLLGAAVAALAVALAVVFLDTPTGAPLSEAPVAEVPTPSTPRQAAPSPAPSPGPAHHTDAAPSRPAPANATSRGAHAVVRGDDGEGPDDRARGEAPDEEPGDEAPPSVWPLDKDGIQGAVQEAVPGLTRCYEEALVRDPALAGRMTLGFTVTDEDGVGKVTVVELDDGAIADDQMAACVLGAFEALQFDAPLDGAMSVTYPMVFENEE